MNYKTSLILLGVCAAASSHAQAFDDFTPTSTSFSGWNTDRINPQTFAITGSPSGGGNALDLGVSYDSGATSDFYNYHGMQKTANISSDWTVSADLYVSADMTSSSPTNFYDTGVWTRDNNPNENNAWYGILEYMNTPGSGGGAFYYWDGNAGQYDEVGGSVTSTGWYSLTMAEVGTTMDYYINNTLVESYANASQVGNSGLQTVFLESNNQYTTPTSGSTDVFWQNVEAAPSGSPEPAAMAAMWGSAIPFVVGAIRRRRKNR